MSEEKLKLITTVIITDELSKETIKLKIIEVNDHAEIEVSAKLSSEDQSKYHMLTLLSMASVLRGLEHPDKIFDLQELAKMQMNGEEITPTFGGSQGGEA